MLFSCNMYNQWNPILISITGHLSAACICLQVKLDKALLWYACRKHIGEVLLTHVWKALKIEASQLRDIELFKRFCDSGFDGTPQATHNLCALEIHRCWRICNHPRCKAKSFFFNMRKKSRSTQEAKRWLQRAVRPDEKYILVTTKSLSSFRNVMLYIVHVGWPNKFIVTR